MKNENIEITIDLSVGNKKFTAYTMDLSKEYIEINSDYRSQVLKSYKIQLFMSNDKVSIKL